MTRTLHLVPRDVVRLDDIRVRLDTLGDDAGDLEAIAGDVSVAIRELLATDVAVAYGVESDEAGRQHLSFVQSRGADEPRFSDVFRRYVIERSGRWAAYDPTRPELGQRNRVLSWSPEALAGMATPIYRELFPALGLQRLHQLRVLACDGPSLLGWFGAYQAAPFDERQTALLAALVPSLRRRFTLERQLALAGMRPVLEAALEAVGRAAFVVDAQGRVVEQNSVARLLLDGPHREGTREHLAHAARGGATPAWSVTRVRRSGLPEHYLVLEDVDPGQRTAVQLAKARVAWALTERQASVLVRVAVGDANKTIGAALGIAERTVEIHVTALLEKAQATSRAELVGRLFTLP